MKNCLEVPSQQLVRYIPDRLVTFGIETILGGDGDVRRLVLRNEASEALTGFGRPVCRRLPTRRHTSVVAEHEVRVTASVVLGEGKGSEVGFLRASIEWFHEAFTNRHRN